MKKFLALVGFVCLLSFTQACATKLASGGPYNGNTTLYQADQSIKLGYDVLHAFVKWEHDNRAVLWKLEPKIKFSADNIRANAQKWVAITVSLRDIYAQFPTDANKTSLESSINTLNQAITEAQGYLQKYGTSLYTAPVTPAQ